MATPILLSAVPDLNARRHYFADLIRPELRKTVEGAIAAGRALVQAKAELDHGEFTMLVRHDLGLSMSKALRLRQLAANPLLANFAHAHTLPSSWTTLAELARFEPDELERALREGAVTPKTERADVPKLRARMQRELGKPRKGSSGSHNTITRRALADRVFDREFSAAVKTVPRADRPALYEEILKLVRQHQGTRLTAP
jgi:hypothetical protein